MSSKSDFITPYAWPNDGLHPSALSGQTFNQFEVEGRVWRSVADFGAEPNTALLQTEAFQKTIDWLADRGGGCMVIPKGHYMVSRINLKSHVHLHLNKFAHLVGSPCPSDYGKGLWSDALISGEGLTDIGIQGPGSIDGANVRRKGGEEGFRGPHTIHLENCREVSFRNLEIKQAGNYAALLKNCERVVFDHFSATGGHDGIHIQACSNVTLQFCDLRTGGDCIAGTDNRSVSVEDCYFNSSCNAFRLGVVGLAVRRCRFQGPGEHVHQVSAEKGKPRFSMGYAFIHFAPKDRAPKFPSDNWLIEDCEMDNLLSIYHYDFEKGVWQDGQPAKVIRFSNIRATRLVEPLHVVGDAARSFQLTLLDVLMEMAESKKNEPVIELSNFDTLHIEECTFSNAPGNSVVLVGDGNILHASHCSPLATDQSAWKIKQISRLQLT